MNKLIKFQTILTLCLFIVSCSNDEDIENINSFPVAQNLTMTVDDGATTEMELVATDSDYDALTFSIVDAPSMGTVTINGVIATYIPNENADGTDSFTYKANDGIGDSNIATVTVNINGSFILAGTYTSDKTLTADKIWNIGLPSNPVEVAGRAIALPSACPQSSTHSLELATTNA